MLQEHRTNQRTTWTRKQMTTMRNIWTALLLLATTPALLAIAGAPVEEVKRIPFSAQVTVRPDGTADVGDIAGLKDPIATFVRTKIAATKFIPGKKDGKPGAASTEMRGLVVLVPSGAEEYEIGLQGISLAPRSIDLPPPRYPRGASRYGNENAVLLLIRIKADGKVAPVKVLESTSVAFVKPTLDQARKWRFEPQLFDGVPVEIEVPILVAFGSGSVSVPTAAFECVWDELRPRAEGQACLLDGLTVIKSI